MATVAKTRECKACGKPFESRDATYCSDECRNQTLKRPARPSCKAMMDLMAQHKLTNGDHNWTAIGRAMGTTSKTAHIWAEQYGLVPVKFYIGKVFY